ncbi:MAG: TonB-dependent receptor [Spongiibacteraceae bacterium]
MLIITKKHVFIMTIFIFITLPAFTFAAALEEVMVTAQKREQGLQDVPLSAEVLSENTLSLSKIDTTVDLALASPSINFQQGWSPFISSFGMRGVNTFAFEGGIQPSVSFIVDGVPIARTGEFQAELGDIERIEVLRGPQGTLFGRNATAGAISVIRKKPTMDFEASLGGSITDDNEYIGTAMISGPLTETVRGRISVYGKQLGDYIENAYPGQSDEGGENSWGILGKLEVDFNPNANILVTAEYTQRDTSISPTISIIPEDGSLGDIRRFALGYGDITRGQAVIDDPFKISTNQSTVSDTENWGISADLTWDLSDSLRLKSIASYRSFFLSNELDVDASPANPINTLNQPVIGWGQTNYSLTDDDPFTFDTDYFSEELRFEGKNGDVEWIVGGFYQLYNDRPKSETPLLFADYIFEFSAGLPGNGIAGDDYYFQTNPVSAEATWESWSIFADTTWYFAERWNVFVGLRWTQEDIEMKYRRRDIIGPAESPYFNPLTDDFVVVDLPGLQADPLWSLFQRVTDFRREDRSEDWSGRIGFSWDFSDNTNAYISVSRGFVGSGVNFGRNAAKSNSIINPSVSKSFELGMKSQLLDDRLRLNLAAFRQETTDLQTSGLIPGTIINETFNAGILVSTGLEINMTWLPTDTLSVDFSSTFLDTEIKDLLQPCYVGQTSVQGCNIDLSGDGIPENQDVEGKDGVVAPDISYRISLRQDVPFDELPFDAYVMVNYTWQDETYMTLDHDPMAIRDDFGVTDMFVGLTHRDGRYELSLFCKNITDEQYYSSLAVTYGSIARLQGQVSRGAQRYFGVKAKYNFW